MNSTSFHTRVDGRTDAFRSGAPGAAVPCPGQEHGAAPRGDTPVRARAQGASRAGGRHPGSVLAPECGADAGGGDRSRAPEAPPRSGAATGATPAPAPGSSETSPYRPHPMIKPALRRAWRDRQTVQYGMAPAHAMVYGPVDDATAAFMEMLDGTRNMTQLREAAVAHGLPAGTADQVCERLGSAGVLDDSTAHREDAAQVPDRLRPDLASLSVVHREPGGGVRRLAARRRAGVQVRGAGRVGNMIATTLTACGVGHVEVVDGGHVQPWDTAPGGVGAGQVGERRNTAARKAVTAARPWRPHARQHVDLVIIAPRDGVDVHAPDLTTAERFVEAGTPHLFSGVVEATGVVGPFVLPGTSPCAGCLMRQRADREPSWPLVVGQWRTGGRRGSGIPACDTALATMVAGVTASYALGFLDGDGACASGYRMRFTLPHLVPAAEHFRAHQDCPCGAAPAGASGRPAVSAPPGRGGTAVQHTAVVPE